MLSIGITGGIGSGKSTVCRIFEVLGVPVYVSDERAKFLMRNDKALIAGIVSLFGPLAYDGRELDRKLIADRVFSDKNMLGKLNSLVHPAVGEDYMKWRAVMEKNNHLYVIQESAILFESGFDKYTDMNVTVSAPEDVRLERVMIRDNAARESVIRRMASQVSDQKREQMADYAIINDGECMLTPQVLKLHELFQSKSR